jgi:hypothetical protein
MQKIKKLSIFIPNGQTSESDENFLPIIYLIKGKKFLLYEL